MEFWVTELNFKINLLGFFLTNEEMLPQMQIKLELFSDILVDFTFCYGGFLLRFIFFL